MDIKSLTEKYSPLKQMVPSSLCFTCDVCCRFPEETSFLAPYFTEEEIAFVPDPKKSFFDSLQGAKTQLIRHPEGEGCLCPHFDPKTQHCTIYEARPLDCRIYPFAILRDQAGEVALGIDTKCPFIQEHAWDPQMKRDAAEVKAFLESEPIVSILESHPGLIGRFQDDVILLHPLDRITERVGRIDPSADDRA
jgi:Fe-S-cluster containining protein